jgi:hypothetical protein
VNMSYTVHIQVSLGEIGRRQEQGGILSQLSFTPKYEDRNLKLDLNTERGK